MPIQNSPKDGRKKIVVLDGETIFESIKDMETVIKQFIKESLKNIELKPKIILDLINDLHEGVKKHNQKCTSIKILNWDGQINDWEWVRERFGGAMFVIGYFEPYNKWHGVTLYPNKKSNVLAKLKTALRLKHKEFICLINDGEKCEDCGRDYPQFHHDSEQFKDVFEKCYIFFSEVEKNIGLGWDWWKHEQESDALSNDHPATKMMFKLHKRIKYKWLCKECHKLHHKEFK